MNKISTSASKIVLLYIVGILGVLTLIAGGYSVVTETYGDAAQVIITAFSGAVTFLFGFYFGSKGEPSEPYAGK